MRLNRARLFAMLAAQSGKVTWTVGVDGHGGRWRYPDFVQPSGRTFDDLVDGELLRLDDWEQVGQWRFAKATPTERGLAEVRCWLAPGRRNPPTGLELQV